MRRVLFFCALLFVTIFSSCDANLEEETSITPVKVFDDFWKAYDLYYANFKVKEIDWDDTYTVYRKKVSNDISYDSLFNVLNEIELKVLKDGHSYLGKSKSFIVTYKPLGKEVDDRHIVSSNCQLNLIDYMRFNHDYLDYGVVKGNASIGYIHAKTFMTKDDGYDLDSFKEDLDLIMSKMKKKEALIIDIRNNTGGYSPWANYFAGYFSSHSYKYLTEKTRYNSNRYDLKEVAGSFVVHPSGDFVFKKPVLVLMNRYTASAAEIFILAVRDLPQVRTFGFRTFGIFSPSIYRELINGWYVRIPVSEIRLTNGNSYEGIGITPRFPTRSIIENYNVDLTLKNAIEYAVEH